MRGSRIVIKGCDNASLLSAKMTFVDTILSKFITLPILLVTVYLILKKPVPVPLKHLSRRVKTEIEPVRKDFNWKNKQPHPYRPFKSGDYKLKLDVVKIAPEEWLLVENTYKTRIEAKQDILKTHYSKTVYANADAEEAICEFYGKVLKFMMNRYPKYFYTDQEGNFHNGILNIHFPVDTAGQSMEELICNLSMVIEEDFIILQSDKDVSQDEYVFKAGCFAFAGGFDPSERFNKPMSQIHGPVPTYKEKLRSILIKFFDRMQPGMLFSRNNWFIQLHDELCVLDPNVGSDGSHVQPLAKEDLDFNKVYMRSERQCLTKLESSNAMVFTIRTYLTSISQIKREGNGDRMIEAITQMQEPIGQYKGRSEWGPAVVDYLSDGKVVFS